MKLAVKGQFYLHLYCCLIIKRDKRDNDVFDKLSKKFLIKKLINLNIYKITWIGALKGKQMILYSKESVELMSATIKKLVLIIFTRTNQKMKNIL